MRIAALSSSKDPLFKKLRSLRTADGRRSAGEFLLEDEEAIEAALASGLEPTTLLATEAYLEAAPGWLSGLERTVLRVSPGLMHKLFPTGKQPALVAALPTLPRPLAEAGSGPRWLVLEDIQDAGNLGTIVRTAAGLGVPDVVWLDSERTDPHKRVAVRASMGARFRVRLWQASLADLTDHLGRHGIALLCTTPRGPERLQQASPAGPWALAVGNETDGASEALQQAAAQCVRLDMSHDTESLNAAVFTGIALYALTAGAGAG